MNDNIYDSMMFEHRFWLQILGDHSRFIHQSLAPNEHSEIERAKYFIDSFDDLLDYARKELSAEELHALNERASLLTQSLREFKLYLLERHLISKISLSLSPTFLNHMVNELEEYERILNAFMSGNPSFTPHPIDVHLLWLSDAVGHAATITSLVDMVEYDTQQKSERFANQFQHYYLKAIELAGYLRTHLAHFPALHRFNHQAEMEMKLFQVFLQELMELRMDNELLGVLTPLMADHMSREECYYLLKLSQVTDVKSPDCYPTKPRVE